MRIEMLGCALAASMLFVGPLPEFNGALTRKVGQPPAWLAIPETASVKTVSFTGAPDRKRSRGMVKLLPSSAAVETAGAITGSLARRGFHIRYVRAARAEGTSSTSLISASHPVSGRKATLAIHQVLGGAELRISFSDPGKH